MHRGGEEEIRERERGSEKRRHDIKVYVTVPCRRTPPFFRKKGLPGHIGGLDMLQKKEREREKRESMSKEEPRTEFAQMTAL